MTNVLVRQMTRLPRAIRPFWSRRRQKTRMRLAAWVIAAGLSLVPVLQAAAGAGVRDQGVAWLFFIDDLHIDFRTTGIVRAWLLSLLEELIRENDVFAARTTGPSSLSVGWLAGVPDLEHGMIRRVAGSALKRQEIEQSPAGSDEAAYRAKVSLRAATEFMATAPRHDSRRRVMLYVGKGFDPAEAVDETQRFLTEAWRLGVTLIAIDAAALPGAQRIVPGPLDAEGMRRLKAARNSLEALALPTRGFVLADEKSLREAPVLISSAIR